MSQTFPRCLLHYFVAEFVHASRIDTQDTLCRVYSYFLDYITLMFFPQFTFRYEYNARSLLIKVCVVDACHHIGARYHVCIHTHCRELLK